MQEPKCYGHMPHNFQHVTKSNDNSGLGYTQQAYIYCTRCGDVIEIAEEDESE